MVKTALQRHHNQRLLDKYSKLVSDRRKEWLTLGKVFSEDPFGCGSPKCRICGKADKGRNKNKEKWDLDKFYNESELPLQVSVLLDGI